LDNKDKAFVTNLILNGNVEKALELLAHDYGVVKPELKVGLPKGRKRNSLGCYNTKKKTIYILNSDMLKQPFIILHEFYHHLRTSVDLKHRGTERNADIFARDFIQAYNSMVFERFGK
jgi:hypothetical protein